MVTSQLKLYEEFSRSAAGEIEDEDDDDDGGTTTMSALKTSAPTVAENGSSSLIMYSGRVEEEKLALFHFCWHILHSVPSEAPVRVFSAALSCVLHILAEKVVVGCTCYADSITTLAHMLLVSSSGADANSATKNDDDAKVLAKIELHLESFVINPADFFRDFHDEVTLKIQCERTLTFLGVASESLAIQNRTMCARVDAVFTTGSLPPPNDFLADFDRSFLQALLFKTQKMTELINARPAASNSQSAAPQFKNMYNPFFVHASVFFAANVSGDASVANLSIEEFRHLLWTSLVQPFFEKIKV